MRFSMLLSVKWSVSFDGSPADIRRDDIQTIIDRIAGNSNYVEY